MCNTIPFLPPDSNNTDCVLNTADITHENLNIQAFLHSESQAFEGEKIIN